MTIALLLALLFDPSPNLSKPPKHPKGSGSPVAARCFRWGAWKVIKKGPPEEVRQRTCFSPRNKGIVETEHLQVTTTKGGGV